MPKKSLNPLEDPPAASSSDEEEVETSSGEEEESSSSGAVTIAVPGKTTAAKEASDSDSGSETETDSESETERPKNPGSEKAVAVTVVSPSKPKKNEASAASSAVKPATKRPSEGTSRDAKRAKKVTSGDEEKKIGEDTKKPAFQRLWSEEDEITVLQGMIDFKANTHKSPYEDSNGFYEFIKKSISFEVSKNQFMDKIRSLKKKYMGKVKNGVEPTFSKAHDQKSYELSKFIWGPEGIAVESNVKSNGVSRKSQKSKTLESVKQELSFDSPNGNKKVEDDVVHGGEVESYDWFEKSNLVRTIVSLGVDEYCVKQKWRLVSEETKKKIEKKLKVLQAKEMEMLLEKTEFLHEVTCMIAEVSKN